MLWFAYKKHVRYAKCELRKRNRRSQPWSQETDSCVLKPAAEVAASWQQEVGNVFKLCRSSACYCGLRVRLQLWFWMKRLASRGCSASAAICSAGNGLRWRAGSLPPKKTTVLWGAMAWGGVCLAELQLHWQQRCLQGRPGYRWVQLRLPVEDQRDALGGPRY